MGRRRKKTHKRQAFCIVCGKWAKHHCSFCGLPLCDAHCTEWGDEKIILTCSKTKCQGKISKDVRQATLRRMLDTNMISPKADESTQDSGEFGDAT